MNKILAIILFLQFMLISGCATTQTDNTSQRAAAHYKIGLGYMNESKIQLAFVEFQKAYEINPGNKEVLYAIGIIYLQYFDETLKAIDFFQKAVAIDPEYSEAYNSLGIAQEKLGNFNAAIPYYKRAVSYLLYSTPEKAFINMGRAYYRLKSYQDALTAYKEAIKRAPQLDLPFLGMALCFNAMGNYGDASAAMSRAISLSPAYKGDSSLAAQDFAAKKLTASKHDQQDLSDYIEILKY